MYRRDHLAPQQAVSPQSPGYFDPLMSSRSPQTSGHRGHSSSQSNVSQRTQAPHPLSSTSQHTAMRAAQAASGQPLAMNYGTVAPQYSRVDAHAPQTHQTLAPPQAGWGGQPAVPDALHIIPPPPTSYGQEARDDSLRLQTSPSASTSRNASYESPQYLHPGSAGVPLSPSSDLSSDGRSSVSDFSDDSDPPPAYDKVPPLSGMTHAWDEPSATATVPVIEGISKPCVVPQISKTFKGAAFSPFGRAYAPELANVGISEKQFLRFIDELNDAFIANPPLQALDLVGTALGFVPYHWFALAGFGVNVVAGAATGVVSKFRTKDYLAKSNEKLFHPRGLHVEVCSTKVMTRKTEFPTEKLELPELVESTESEGEELDLEQQANEASQIQEGTDENDPRIRRVRALEGYVLPITFNVSAPLPPNSLLAKLSRKSHERASKKQIQKLLKERQKARHKSDKGEVKATKEGGKGEKEIRKLEREMEKVQLKGEKEVRKAQRKGSEKERVKAEKERDKEVRKVEKEMNKKTREKDKEVSKIYKEESKDVHKAEKKEHKIANRLMWIVVTKHKEESEEDVLDLEADEESPTSK